MSKIQDALPKPKIELYSGQYFAACGLGGIIGLYLPMLQNTARLLTVYNSLRPYTHRSHSSRSRKMPETSRLFTLQIQLWSLVQDLQG